MGLLFQVFAMFLEIIYSYFKTNSTKKFFDNSLVEVMIESLYAKNVRKKTFIMKP